MPIRDLAAAVVRRRGRRQPCEVPSLPHSLNSRFYPGGWRCDRHSPWALAGHDSPTPRVTTNETPKDA
ncbi:hypothetical protein E4N62_46710 [Streptomyces sp. MNU76]|uniref:hypothetical protein n=1 Tax=Streptomyces sp. MNU76 TaxID=2560026 RepID=UPI001E2959A7|nr:hypothetical protein [Streptomyces sp. MNU76]MCC9712049.1 hypothetical protein [Streptomyces sp. MNU76]